MQTPTELDHQIRVWQALDLQVHLIHTAGLDDNLRAMRMEDRGCVVYTPREWAADKETPAGDAFTPDHRTSRKGDRLRYSGDAVSMRKLDNVEKG